VLMGLVDHLQALWREGLSQLFCDDVGNVHGRALIAPLQMQHIGAVGTRPASSVKLARRDQPFP
jgi:hypothetical protein